MKVKLSQLEGLEFEIAGVRVGENQVLTGLVKEEIAFKAKYWLQKLLKKVTAEKQSLMEAEKELFISLGAVEVDGLLTVKDTLEDGSPNPSLEKLKSERASLYDQEVDLGEFNFDIEDFTFNSKCVYPVFTSIAFPD